MADDHEMREHAFEASDDIPDNPLCGERTIGDIINRRYGRREVMAGALGVTAATALFGSAALKAAPAQAARGAQGRYHFPELKAGVDETHHVAEGYDADILLRWGDPIFADSPDFDPENQTAEKQLRQFGYNNDYLGLIPLDDKGNRGILCVNHEYTSEEVMFPGVAGGGLDAITKELAAIEMAAHGGSVVEIARGADGKWSVQRDSRYNRRITASHTPMTFDGPAAGHERLKTSADPHGRRVIGTFNNCAGGVTAWGTYLMAEENFHGYFWSDHLDDKGKPMLEGADAANYKRYGVPGRWYNWGQHEARFNIDKEPNEPHRFGWIVEVDPLDPSSIPVKHTALGRFGHEGAESVVAPSGHVVLYSGDDKRFDYLYKFVSSGRYHPGDRAGNKRLLSEGTLYVARFDEDGSLSWLPLIFGQGPLTPANGFADQAEVLIFARRAGDLLEATPMDRPEDVEPDQEGRAYVMLTNNTKRKEGQVNAANPRPANAFGHIIEITEAGGDPTATTGRWDILVSCGDPKIAEVGASWNPEQSDDGWFGSPDNCALDAVGRLWISTDQGKSWAKTGKSDGLYGLERAGPLRGQSRLFFRAPVGAEVCGPFFTPNLETVFIAVQHPATDGTKDYEPFGRASSYEDPATRWPDFDERIPPRPSVLAITRKGGGKIATE